MSSGKASLNLLLLLVSTLLTFVLLEVCARVYLEHLAPEPRFLSYASYRQLLERYGTDTGEGATLKQIYSPHRYLGFYPTPDYRWQKNRHNALGYRGEEIALPKPPGEFRIACLGGSTTYTSDIDDHLLSYPSLLQRELRLRGHEQVTVVNAAAASWTTWESLINLELRVLDLDPDLIIVYHAINDVHARIVWPQTAFRGDNSGWRAPNQSGLFMPSIFEYSTLLRILMIRAGWTGAHADLARTIDRSAPTYYADRFREQVRAGVYPQGIFKEVSAARMLEENGPKYFERNLEAIAATARAHGVEVVFASFAYSKAFAEEPRVSTIEYQQALAEHNRVIEAVAMRAGAHFFDFAGLFPSDDRYFTDGRHVNEEGSALKARLFADFLVKEELVAD